MRICKLTLYTSNLKAQIEFYKRVLELKPLSQDLNSVTFKIGLSQLKFIYNKIAKPYHFAINIPSGEDIKALNWLKSKVEILINGESEIHDFKFWNAKAIYFYDADKNIVELISRNNLAQFSNSVFQSGSMLEISEIGMPSSCIEKDYKWLNKNLGIEVFSGSFDQFCAIGDEHGLFICIDSNRKWFPMNDQAFVSDFDLELMVHSKRYHITYKGGQLNLL